MATRAVASPMGRTRRFLQQLKTATRLLPAIGALALPPVVSAQFVRIAGFDTLVPGGPFTEFVPGVFTEGTDRFNGFGVPGITDREVVFLGNASGILAPLQLNGLFRAPATGGAVRELVTRRTWLPEYGGPRPGPTAPNGASEGVFSGFNTSLMEVKDGRVVFAATTQPAHGVIEVDKNVYSVDLRVSGDRLRHGFRAQDNRPTGDGTYEPIINVMGAFDRLAVHAGNPAGLYQRGSAGNQTIVDATMPVPGASFNFSLLGAENVAYSGGAAFIARSPTAGQAIWRKNDTDTDILLLRKSDLGGVASEAAFPLFTFNQLRTDTRGALSFLGGAAGNGPVGIFTQRTPTPLTEQWRRADFATIATTATPAPSGTGNFTSFSRIATSSLTQVVETSLGPSTYLDVDVAFTARDPSGREAIYAYLDDQISSAINARQVQRIVGVGDTLDGKRISHVQIGRNAIHRGTVAFWTRFEDNTEAVYTVPVRAIIPRSGVVVSTDAMSGTVVSRPGDVASGETHAHGASAVSDNRASAAATGDGLASPITGGVRVRAIAQVDGFGFARSSVTATQRFLVLGANNGDLVDVDLNFSVSGQLGVANPGGGPANAAVGVTALLFQSGAAPHELFDGFLTLHAGPGLVNLDREGDYALPGTLGDILVAPNPFGDGRDATGASILTARTFLSVTQARVGETLAVQYQIWVAAESEGAAAIADFSHTLGAFASTTTPGASLAMIHAVPAIPEPGQLALLLGGLVLVFAKVRTRRTTGQCHR